MLLFYEIIMETQNQTGASGLIARTLQYVRRKALSYSKNSLKRGLRHGYRRYSRAIDSFLGGGQMDYSVQDILRGEVEEDVIVQNHKIGTRSVEVQRPRSNYKIGRYMAMAENLLRHGIESGDTSAALTGVYVYQWLGQGNRKSVHNKLQRVYDKANEMSTHYGVPLSVDGDRRMAIMPSDNRREIERYLASSSK